MGIDHTLKFFDDLGKTVVKVLDVARSYKSGGLWAVIGKVAPLMDDIAVIVTDAKASLPELADLDPAEGLQVGAAAYSAIKKIAAAA